MRGDRGQVESEVEGMSETEEAETVADRIRRTAVGECLIYMGCDVITMMGSIKKKREKGL
jgi:hypothetical protein